MWVAYVLNYCDRQAVFSMFPSLKAGFGMTDEQLGLTGALFLWVYAIGCPIAGQIGDRCSKRLLVVLSLVVWSIVTVATGFAGSAFVLLGLRAAMGISESLFMPTAIALTANAHPPGLRSRAIAVLTTAQIAGTVAGSWFGGWMADRELWRGAFSCSVRLG
jgi:MFS family permease